MSDGVHQSLFIMFEMTLVPNAEDLIDFVARKTQIPKEYIFIAATHTHGTPAVSLVQQKLNSKAAKKQEQWYEAIKETLLDTIKRAQENMGSCQTWIRNPYETFYRNERNL